MNTPPSYFTTKEAAAFLGRRSATLRSWRYRNIGPAYWQPVPGAPALYTEDALKLYKLKMKD